MTTALHIASMLAVGVGIIAIIIGSIAKKDVTHPDGANYHKSRSQLRFSAYVLYADAVVLILIAIASAVLPETVSWHGLIGGTVIAVLAVMSARENMQIATSAPDDSK
ncbi:MAG: hypothetical protein Q4P05_05005 [Actinomycetaceae bacterium]|nr:hypothetical protein [Actinomycetaceae bacterium]